MMQPFCNGSYRSEASGLAPAALRQSCNAVDGCQKERCVSLAAAGIASAPGECRCLHDCDATEPDAPAAVDAGGGGCNVARTGSGTLFLLVASSVFAAFRRRRRC